jgi:hypothetical protein
MPCFRLLFACSLSALFTAGLCAQEHPPITSLGQTADVVVIAQLRGIVEPGGKSTPNITIQLTVQQYLKGQTPSLNLVATIPARAPRNMQPATMPVSSLGAVGIWFLKTGSENYQILPRDNIYYHSGDLYLPLNDTSSAAGANALNDRLLAYLVRWYQSLATPGMMDTAAFFSAFGPGYLHGITTQQILIAVAPLLQSPVRSQQLSGLMVALRVGSIPAMQTVLANMRSLSEDALFSAVTESIGTYPKDAAWIPILRQLAEMHTDIPGMDAAAVGALRLMRTKAALPVLAEFLDSKDPGAQINASYAFAQAARFATSQGEVPDNGANGPFWTPRTQAFMPGSKPSLSADQYASFWKSWWSQNSGALGFAVQ